MIVKSPTAHDAFWPIQDLINCAAVVGTAKCFLSAVNTIAGSHKIPFYDTIIKVTQTRVNVQNYPP